VDRNQQLPDIRIVPVDKLVLHEYHDNQRTPPIVRHLEESGVLRNPPIVMPLDDGSERYMVLDGANRATALQAMQIPHIVVQIVNASDPGVELSPWNHIVCGINPDTLLDWARSIPLLNLLPSDQTHRFGNLLDIRSLASLHLPDGRIYTASTERINFVQRVRLLNQFVESYASRCYMDRTTHYSIPALKEMYPDLSGLVLLPPFEIEAVLDLVKQGHLMPTGSTRFTISPRALRINFPLGVLSSGQSLAEKSTYLDEWIQESIATKRVRYYAEATILFDE
jgi:hypothetical protein